MKLREYQRYYSAITILSLEQSVNITNVQTRMMKAIVILCSTVKFANNIHVYFLFLHSYSIKNEVSLCYCELSYCSTIY